MRTEQMFELHQNYGWDFTRIIGLTPHPIIFFSTERSKVIPFLQFFFVCKLCLFCHYMFLNYFWYVGIDILHDYGISLRTFTYMFD